MIAKQGGTFREKANIFTGNILLFTSSSFGTTFPQSLLQPQFTVMIPSVMRLLRNLAFCLIFVGILPFAQAEEALDPSLLFGAQERREEALIGILYDFKMNQQREPAQMDPGVYAKVIDAFLSSGWDEALLNQYFRATKPVYTTQICVPLSSASITPRAFGVEKVVQPRMIAVHYKGQVIPPKGGTYRFVGYADDIIAVAVNGRTVLVGGLFGVKAWTAAGRGNGLRAGNGNMTYGDWFDLAEGEAVDLDVLVGERPGGQFAAFLVYERKGETYEYSGPHPVLPLFRLADAPRPHVDSTNGPLLGPNTELWRALP